MQVIRLIGIVGRAPVHGSADGFGSEALAVRPHDNAPALKLPNPKMMDVAVPANMHIGLAQDAVAQKGWAVLADEAMDLVGRPDVALVDLREKSERAAWAIPGALHEPYPKLRDNLSTGGLLRALGANRRVVFYYAYGERSAMAVQAAHEAGTVPPVTSRVASLPGRRRAALSSNKHEETMTEFALVHGLIGGVPHRHR